MTEIIGIDLGTTNSLAAYLAEDGPRPIPNALGQVLTPSVVGVGSDGRIIVGAAARELQVLHPERCASLFKRKMGTDWQAELADRTFTPEELSSLVLRSLKEDAEAFFGHPVNRAVITVPAYFNDQQRKATLNAGRIAGVQVERILNEPTAAAMAYGFHEAGQEKVLLIFDLGGGTFDVSLVELFEGALEVRASSGESFLGGEDFTRTFAARVLEKQGYVFERAELDNPHLVARTLQQCELAKCWLSSHDEASVRVADRTGDLNDQSPRVAVSREAFEKWTGHIMARVELPIRRVLGDASLRREDVHEVILVGGATRMPAVGELVARTFGKEPRSRLNPDEVVALGAAVQAGLIARHRSVDDMVVTDVSPFTLGVEVSKQFGHEHRDGYFLPIIDRNTTIPVSRIHRLATITANQTGVKIRIFQGENRRVEGNLFIGEFSVEGIPRGPAGQSVDLRFTYDLNGVLEIEATIVETAKTVRHVVTRYARGLNNAQIERAIEAMSALKTQPREEAVNRFLIQRAERVYRELTLEQRERLGQLLDGFEEVLSLNDAAAIERHREALTNFLDRCESGDPDQNPFDDYDSPEL